MGPTVEDDEALEMMDEAGESGRDVVGWRTAFSGMDASRSTTWDT